MSVQVTLKSVKLTSQPTVAHCEIVLEKGKTMIVISLYKHTKDLVRLQGVVQHSPGEDSDCPYLPSGRCRWRDLVFPGYSEAWIAAHTTLNIDPIYLLERLLERIDVEMACYDHGQIIYDALRELERMEILPEIPAR